MNIDAQYPSKYLSAADIPEDDIALTIKDVTVEIIGQGESAESKPIVYFQEVKKGLLCNKTNSKTIKGLYGAETDTWIGKRISLFATEVEFKGDQVMAIRVRLKAPKAAPAGNGTAAPMTMKQIWDEFYTANNVTKPDVLSALGTDKVSEWIAAETGRTLEQAMALVGKAQAEF